MTAPSQVDLMIKKIRALVEDFEAKDFQVFRYTNSSTWTLREPNIDEIISVLYNGNPLVSGEGYAFNILNNKITVTGITFKCGDTLEVDYTYHQYSRKTMVEYIRGALTYLSIYDYSTDTYQILGPCPNEFIAPDLSDPSNKTGDLISIITSILILPEYMHYRMPNLAINYPYKKNREERITDLIQRYKQGVGVVDIIMWNRSPGL